MTHLASDLRFALRILRKNPGLTIPAILVLAIGLGATTAVFSVADHVLFRPLAVPDADRLVTICESHLSRGDFCTASTPNVLDWAERSSSFSALGAGRSWSYFVDVGGSSKNIDVGIATPGFLTAVGVPPAVGRLFDSAEMPPRGSGRVIVLSHELWQSAFGGSTDAIGKSIVLDGQSYSVIGVLPANVVVPRVERVQAWLPVPWDPREERRRDWRGFVVAGRLHANVSRAQAEAELRSIQSGLEAIYPNQLHGWRVDVLTMQDRIVGSVRPMLLAFLAAVALVLLLVCVNVAALLLARATGREREIAVRYALGASASQVLRQLLVESAVLCLLGGLAGVLVAVWTIDAFIALAPPGIPRLAEVVVDTRVLSFVFGISAIAAVATGLVPGLRMVGGQTQMLRAGRAQSASRRASRTRQVLVAAELAIALTLVAGAGLLLESFVGLLKWQPPFDPDRILTFQVFVPQAKYSNRDQVRGLYRRIEESLAALPGIESASTASAGPLFGGGDGEAKYIIEGSSTSADENASVAWFDVGPAYFRTMSIAPVRGRLFTEQDTGVPEIAVVLVNETMARRWPDANPVGARIRLPEMGNSIVEIIGVVADVPSFDPGMPPAVQMYFTNRQYTRLATFFVLRAATDVPQLREMAERAVKAIEPTLQPSAVATIRQRMSGELVRPRFNLLLIGLFAVIALMLGVVGVYGLIAYAVDVRAKEIGIRLALGGKPRQIALGVVSEAIALCSAGATVGIGGAMLFGRFLSGILHGVSPTDPSALVWSVALLISCGVAAAIMPAIRAARTDPVMFLRSE